MIGLQQYVYDGLDLLAEVSAVGQLQAGHTHGPGIDDPLVARYNNANYYYHKNHSGSVTEITSGNQSIVKTYEYDAYGNILQETGPSLTGGFTYTARELHTRSGLYYYRARFYDPRTGRFLTQDLIGFLGGVNLYACVGNSPVSFRDPYGLCEKGPTHAFMDWLMNDFVVPGPYGSPDQSDWGDWVSLPYEAGKFGKDWEYATWGAIGTATAVTTAAVGLGSGIQFVAHGGRAWHYGIDLAGGRNLIHLGKHITYGTHIGTVG